MDPLPDYGLNSYKGSGKLVDKVAIITGKDIRACLFFVQEFFILPLGGDSGIGRAVAWAFACEGATIVISYLNEHDDAQTIQQAISKIGRECVLVVR